VGISRFQVLAMVYVSNCILLSTLSIKLESFKYLILCLSPDCEVGTWYPLCR